MYPQSIFAAVVLVPHFLICCEYAFNFVYPRSVKCLKWHLALFWVNISNEIESGIQATDAVWLALDRSMRPPWLRDDDGDDDGDAGDGGVDDGGNDGDDPISSPDLLHSNVSPHLDVAFN